jgi:L-threonylcarbamoyladenylate synthase
MNATNEEIQTAVRILKDGGIVIYPTDTAFGIGCRIDDKKAVDRLFDLRKRPLSQATPVLVSSVAMALSYFESPNDIVRHLMKLYWPGALTIIANCNIALVHSPIRGGGKTIGMRQPDHETAIRIIHEVGVPVLGPSANFHGLPTPYTYESLDPELIRLVDYVVPGVGKAGNVSTVVDTTTDPVTIVRQGAVLLQPEDIV